MTVTVTCEAILAGPVVEWGHVDGPLMSWAGQMHWLTIWERVRISLRLSSVESVAKARFPHIERARRHLLLIANLERGVMNMCGPLVTTTPISNAEEAAA